MNGWRARVRQLKSESYALYLASKDPRVPWGARVFVVVIVAYAFSPIDLIPDFIPVLGYLDDLILIPLGIYLVLKLIPPQVMAECRAQAQQVMAQGKPISRSAGVVIVAIWLAVTMLGIYYLTRLVI